MSNIADPLRHYVDELCNRRIPLSKSSDLYKRLTAIADQIDAENERQMTERGSAHKVLHGNGEYGHTTCSACGVTVHRRDKWCWSCGTMLRGEVAEKKINEKNY